MKELTIEQKAKRFDEVIEKFDVILNLNTVKESGTIFTEDVRKILPELKENDGERVKKELILFFTERAKHTEDSTFNGLSSKEIIAWLEKQGEQKHANKVVPVFNIGDTIIKKHNSDINKFGQFKITNITGGKYWYNDRIICDIIEQDEWEIYEPVRQNSTEWGEEDEAKMVKLKSFIAQCKGFNKENRNKAFDLIDSIKFRHTWFPSKEQMKALNAINTTGCISYPRQGQELINLYNNLKKLRE